MAWVEMKSVDTTWVEVVVQNRMPGGRLQNWRLLWLRGAYEGGICEKRGRREFGT